MGSDLLGIGISGLNYHQAALNTTGHNITNAASEGFSRQRVIGEASIPFQKGPNFFGSGVSIQSVERIADEFLIRQLQMDTAAFNQMDAYVAKISQLDNLIGNDEYGLLSGVDKFFSAVQNASSDPASLSARQLVLTQSDGLAQRFNDIYSRFDDLNDQINSEAKSMTSQLNVMAQGIADINLAISKTSGSAEQINDLLDQRDELVRSMAEIAEVSVVKQNNGSLDIFIGSGQALVVGTTVNKLQVTQGQFDSARMDIKWVSGSTSIIVTSQMGGGKLGGLMQFRSQVLDPAMNSVGRIAIGIADAMNQQQHSGLDLNGNYGVDLFSDLNAAESQFSRVGMYATNAAPGGQNVTVGINDVQQLTDSDYELKFIGNNGGSYELLRLTDHTVVASGAMQSARPMVISADGFDITLNSGTFSQGDRVLIQPTRHGARDFSVESLRSEYLAFAAPLVSKNDLGNLGTGVISPINMLGTVDASGATLPMFQTPGKMSPPLMVRFTSATTYEVLDNSDPANPRALSPPITNQLFIAGQTNQVFASEPGQALMSSDGFNAGRITNNVVAVPPGSQPNNAYINETLTFSYTNPTTGIPSALPALTIAAGTTAQDIAAALSGRAGVTARASTYAEWAITDDGAGLPLQVMLNGVDLTAVTPPVPLTSDYLANAINTDASLQAAGVRAISDGTTLKISSSSGVDFDLQVAGDATDGIRVKGDAGAALTGTVDITNGADFNVGAPTSFTLDIGSGPRTINLSGVYSDQQSVLDYVQSQINAAFNSPSRIRVEAGVNGTLKFVTVNTSHNASLAIAGISNDALGLASAAAAGTVSPADIVLVSGAGAGVRNAHTVGGKVAVTLDAGYQLTSTAVGQGNLFSTQSQAQSNYFGFTFNLSGLPVAGDEFSIEFNNNGVSDNRNALKMLSLRSAGLVEGKYSFADSYGKLVTDVGALGNQAKINKSASEVVLKQTQGLRNSVSAVNLDEEAANLIKYEQGYVAATRVITTAQRMIDSLFEALR